MTPADWAGYAALLTIIAKVVADILTRWQDRLDRESAAALILSELEAKEIRAKLEAAEREKRIVARIDENTEVSKEAFRTANGYNEKIANAVEAVRSDKESASIDSTRAIDASTVAIHKNSHVLEGVIEVLHEDQAKHKQ